MVYGTPEVRFSYLLPVAESKNIGCPIKFEFQITKKFFNMSVSHAIFEHLVYYPVALTLGTLRSFSRGSLRSKLFSEEH